MNTPAVIQSELKAGNLCGESLSAVPKHARAILILITIVGAVQGLVVHFIPGGSFFSLLYLSVVAGGYQSNVLHIVRDEPFDINLFSKNAIKFWRYLVADFICGFAVIVGLIFLIAPGIYLGVRLGLYRFFIADKDAGPIESLKLSWKATEDYFWPVFRAELLGGFLVLVAGSLCHAALSGLWGGKTLLLAIWGTFVNLFLLILIGKIYDRISPQPTLIEGQTFT